MGRSRVTDEQLREAAATAQNLRQLLEAVGLVACGGNYALYRDRLERLGIDDARFGPVPRPQPLAIDVEQVTEAVARSASIAATCRALGVSATGRARRLVQELIEQHGLSTAHFLGQGWSAGRTDLPGRGRALGELFTRGSRISSTKLKRRLVRDGLLAAVCGGCGGGTWLGRPMPLELDHVNGVRDDNRLANLRLLCPNCHALTDTYRGRNIGRPLSVEATPP